MPAISAYIKNLSTSIMGLSGPPSVLSPQWRLLFKGLSYPKKGGCQGGGIWHALRAKLLLSCTDIQITTAFLNIQTSCLGLTGVYDR
jgi:hypothetical protein